MDKSKSNQQSRENGKHIPHRPTAHEKIIRRRRTFRSFIAKSLAKRSFTEKIADEITIVSGSFPFLVVHILWFVSWVVINMGVIPGVQPFDPFPFGLLTMVVSLEAIVLSVFVLLSQNRSYAIDSLRQEVNLQVNLIAEEEITKALELLKDIHDHLHIDKNMEDPELLRMLNRIDTSYIERTLQKQVEGETVPLINRIANVSHGNANGNGNSNGNGETKILSKESKTPLPS